MEPETWSPIRIDDIEWPYQVSTLGRIMNFRNGYILKPLVYKNGYAYVSLSWWPRKQKSYTIHSLVLTAFRGERPEGYWAHHINSNRADNRLVNLIWLLPRDNTRLNSNTKLTPEAVLEIYEALKAFSEKYDCSLATVASIGLGISWKGVNPAYRE